MNNLNEQMNIAEQKNYSSKRQNVIYILMSIVMLLGGYSELAIGGIKVITVLGGIILILLLLQNYIAHYLLIAIVMSASIFYGGILDIFWGHENIVFFVSKIILILLSFALIDYFAKLEQNALENLFKFFVISLFIANLVIFYIVLFGTSHLSLVADTDQYGIRVRGFSGGNANGYAMICGIGATLSLYFMLSKKNILFLTVFLSMVGGMLLAQSRGILIAVILSSLIMCFVSASAIKKISSFFVYFIMLAVLVGIVIICSNYFLGEIGAQQISLSRFSGGSAQMSTISVEAMYDERGYIYDAALDTILTYPQGIGFSSMHLTIGALTGIYFMPHNIFLYYIVAQGILFGSLWTLLWFYVLGKSIVYNWLHKCNFKDFIFHLTNCFFMLILYLITHAQDWLYIYIIVAALWSYIRRETLKVESATDSYVMPQKES